ncbi:four-carbon acid sugar kinase family protein [Microbacterium horticulturae]|uniref:3-oxo-tetronate kinase n=1 Tax=Microbacterium horticulturae TaxID=3028316 RepID=A0ABY8BV19_9MICO|nr:3-oxo-tetronate kinase [Microbacterium sp. KACC 23027]WEG08019.1 four-carbon acid sugar kinase family protein [Microbacterium sp. KACC 23027]
MIGAVADDLTGATDVAAAFRSAGLRVGLFFGGIDAADSTDGLDAVVVGLKTRTVPAADAVERSAQAARTLVAHGCDQIFFKYCSTFDSSPAGNIGPVSDALAAELRSGPVVFAPTTPVQGRTVYQSHLFVGDVLLSDSPMRDHPLTPMTDADLRHVLQAQATRRVGSIPLQVVRTGGDAVAAALRAAQTEGIEDVIVDAVDDLDLDTVAAAVRTSPLVTGAAGLAAALARAHASASTADADDLDTDERLDDARTVAALAGSCSARTREQVARWRQSRPAFWLDPVATPDSAALAEAALSWFDTVRDDGVPLIYSTTDPDTLRRAQAALGAAHAAEIVETALGLVAVGLVRRGVDRLIVAGGETSGEVVRALGIGHGRVGAQAAPGVPWIFTESPAPLAVLLKSGNYGDADLLVRAAQVNP